MSPHIAFSWFKRARREAEDQGLGPADATTEIGREGHIVSLNLKISSDLIISQMRRSFFPNFRTGTS
jgi:hypothetical protein